MIHEVEMKTRESHSEEVEQKKKLLALNSEEPQFTTTNFAMVARGFQKFVKAKPCQTNNFNRKNEGRKKAPKSDSSSSDE